MKAAKRSKLVEQIRKVQGVEPTTLSFPVGLELIKALKTGRTVLVPRPKTGRIDQLHLLNSRVVYSPYKKIEMYGASPVTIIIDEFTDELTIGEMDDDWQATIDNITGAAMPEMVI